MITSPYDTLARHASRPFTTRRDLSQVGVPQVASRLDAFMAADASPATKPESDALWFYGMNHGMAVLSQRFASLEPLGPWVEFVDAYHGVVGPKAVRAFYYLLLICTRESRHVSWAGNFGQKLLKQHGPAYHAFNHCVRSLGSSDTALHFRQHPPVMALGDYVKALAWTFYNGKYGYGYGGPAWGRVADCLVRFVTGEYSPEMLLDTVWTLAHNNGPIFNKGMQYAPHSTGSLLRILDVQRSGQIPALILVDPAVGPYVDADLASWMRRLRDGLPGSVGAYVDWYAVELLGGKGQYHTEKKHQVAKYGPSPLASAWEEKKALKQKKEMEQLAALQSKLFADSHKQKPVFEVMPGLSLQKIERAA